MKLSDLGEDAVVRELVRGLPLGENVILGAGDDCAVLGRSSDKWWRLAKTDAVIQGVHFLPGEKPERVGWKALCRAISDIAAMGGIPEHALITLGVSASAELTWVRGLYAGLRKAARRFGVGIVGGETCRSPGATFISIALTGRVQRECCVTRSGGKVDDAIYVTGQLGGSLAGKHLDFIPRLAEGQWLAAKQPDCRLFLESTSTVAGPTWPNGCHVSEVEIDPSTGELEIVAYASVSDVGKGLTTAGEATSRRRAALSANRARLSSSGTRRSLPYMA